MLGLKLIQVSKRDPRSCDWTQLDPMHPWEEYFAPIHSLFQQSLPSLATLSTKKPKTQYFIFLVIIPLIAYSISTCPWYLMTAPHGCFTCPWHLMAVPHALYTSWLLHMPLMPHACVTPFLTAHECSTWPWHLMVTPLAIETSWMYFIPFYASSCSTYSWQPLHAPHSFIHFIVTTSKILSWLATYPIKLLHIPLTPYSYSICLYEGSPSSPVVVLWTASHLGPILLTWINIHPSMNK